MSIVVQQLSYIHSDKEILFRDIHFALFQGQKGALVGNNGSGKSTLLQIIANISIASGGDVIMPSVPYYVPQHFGQYDQLTVAQALHIDGKLKALDAILKGDTSMENFDLLADDWGIEERSVAALSLWGIDYIPLSQNMGLLSGGEKTRIFLAGMSVHFPDIILLDEPTNHLDTQYRNKLYDKIESLGATMLVVSHDRALLNLLPLTFELSKAGITCYGGNYDFYKEQKENITNALYAKLDEKEKELRLARKIAREVAERKQKQDVRGKKHSEKKGIGKLAMDTLQDRAEKTSSQLKNQHANKMNSIAGSLSEIRMSLPDNKSMKINFNTSGLHTGRILATAKDVNFTYHSRPLWRHPLDFQIKSGDRVAIEGGNGSGKTTLLNLIAGLIKPSEGRLDIVEFKYVYLDQEYTFIKNDRTILEQVMEYNSGFMEHDVKTILNRFLFPPETWNKMCNKLSGGEKMKLALCCLMVNANTPDVFILDEPTNNIDIRNVEILTETIKDFQGTVIVVSHDKYFVEQIDTDYSILLSSNNE